MRRITTMMDDLMMTTKEKERAYDKTKNDDDGRFNDDYEGKGKNNYDETKNDDDGRFNNDYER